MFSLFMSTEYKGQQGRWATHPTIEGRAEAFFPQNVPLPEGFDVRVERPATVISSKPFVPANSVPQTGIEGRAKIG
jgi:hypothetical protein